MPLSTALVRAAVLLGCPQAEAEDVVQATLLRCLRHWTKVQRADQPEAYVYRILVNTLRDALARRWHGEIPTEQLPDRSADTDATVGIAVRHALSRMTREHREVLVLRYYADLSEHATAAILRVPAGTVKSRTARALAVLAADPDLSDIEGPVMLTDDEATTLLHRAAATIDVRHRPLAVPVHPRRRWVGPAAAAAAAVVVVAAVTAGTQLNHPTGTAPSATTASSRPAIDLGLGDPSFRLGPDQVPSIAGLDAAQAKALLEDRGYRVRVAKRQGCPSAGGLSVTPGPGAIAAVGSTVTLGETQLLANVPCPSGDLPARGVTAFLAWARGLGPAPHFARAVEVQFSTPSGGDSTRVLRSARVADRSAWPGLTALADVLAAPVRGRVQLLPLVATRTDATCAPIPGGTCPQMPGADLGGDPGFASSKAETTPLFNVTLELDKDGGISGVVLLDRRPPHIGTAPDVVGDSATYAAQRLQTFGFTVTARDVDGCRQQGTVVGARVTGSSATLEVSRGNRACA